MGKISSVLPRMSMVIIYLLLAFFEQQIYSQQLLQNRYAFNGKVNTVEVGDNTLFVGGDFDFVGQPVRNLTMIDVNTNLANLNLPTTDNDIYGIIPDNLGGWYIYGSFSMVGDSIRKSVAHILPDYSVDSWSISLDGPVYTMLLYNGAIYLGGQFYEVNGEERWLLAAVDTDGNLLNWNLNFDGNTVHTIATDGSVMYCGGYFSTVSNLTRNNLVGIDLLTGTVTPWDPNSNGPIYSMEISDTVIYVGGSFTTISAVVRNNVAAIGSSGNLLNNWNVSVTDGIYTTSVDCIRKYGSVIYLGGNFMKINGYDRTYSGSVDVNGNILNWAPNINDVVYEIVPLDSSVLVGGKFSTVNSQKRTAVVQVDNLLGNTVLPLNANLGNAFIRGMLLQNDNLFLCGRIDIVNGKIRTKIAAIDLMTNEILDWNPLIQNTGTGSYVNSFNYNNGVVFVGGQFDAINGTPRKYLAAIDFPSCNLLSWNPDPNNMVYSIQVVDTVIYFGGTFITLANGSVNRKYLAAISVSGIIMDWDPNPSNGVLSIEVKDTVLYLGGLFTSVLGTTRNRLAAVTTSGNLLPWNPNVSNGMVNTIAKYDTIFYVGGSFNGIGGNSSIRKFAAVDINSSLLVDRSFGGANNTINKVKVFGNNLYVGGLFTSIGTNSRNRIAAIDLQTNTLRDDWIIDANASVNSFGIDDINKVVYVGGNFDLINTSRVVGLAPLTDPTIPAQQTIPTAPSNLTAVADTFAILLNWDDNSATELGFKIERKNGDSLSVDPFVEIDSVGANVTSYNDLGRTPNTTYTYRVRAFNQVGYSLYSNVITATTIIPVELTSFAANISDNEVVISWTTATELNNRGFDLERKLNGEWEKLTFIAGKGTKLEETNYSYIDKFSYTSYQGTAQYRLKQIDFDGTISYSNVISVELDFTPKEYALYQNYPNPFNPATTIKFALPFESSVRIIIYNLLGEKVDMLFEGIKEVGYHDITWNAGRLASGIYLYTIEANSIDGTKNYTSVKKMMLMK